MADIAKRPNYHHGDLRNALLLAALDLLEREGLDRLTLRGVAAAVGVSHAAPAHHFGTLNALRTALAIIGYERFTLAMRTKRAEAPADPAAQMRAARQGYLAFARSQPALFRLMFTSTLLDWSDRTLQVTARISRAELTDICAPAADLLGLHAPRARLIVERLVWSEVHGLAHLAIDGQLAQDLPGCEDPTLTTDGSPDLAALLFGRQDRP